MTTQETNKIAALQAVIPKLKANDQKFALDLCAAYQKWHKLSVNQWPWVDKLIARANEPSKPPILEVIHVGGFEGVVALFAKAKTHLKFPKIILQVDNKPIVLALAGPKSKVPGSINVMGEGKFPDRVWYGRVSPEGEWTPSHKVTPEFKDALTILLGELAKHPAQVAKAYGILTGNCCFCHKALGYGEDKRSVLVGFGPVCAAHYGLLEEWKAAAELVPSESDIVAEAPETPPLCYLCGEKPGTLEQAGFKICVSCAIMLAGA